MKKQTRELLTVIFFCGFLLAVLLGYLLLPKQTFSVSEKRYLAEPPKLTQAAVLSGDWGQAAEDYLADHMPLRDFFVGLNAYVDLFTGRQVSREIWVVDQQLVEAPKENDQEAISRNLSAIQNFSETIGQTVDLAIVPSAGWATGMEAYQDEAIIQSIQAQAGEHLNAVDLLPVFRGRPELYYKTDHHWNSQGAYEAYQLYMASMGREARPEGAFTKTVYPGFRGSTYSRSALWLTPGEALELWQGSDSLTVTNGEAPQPHEGVFYRERLEEVDMYTVFLDGNHSLVRIENPQGEGKLLVIRDSFSNSLGCFLAESFSQVVLVDLRYYKQPVSALAIQEGFDRILVCYSLSNFLTDPNLVFLR